jgi:CBS domain-containing protein
MRTADTVGELMRSPLVTIEGSATVAQAISLMDVRNIGAVVVTRGHMPEGLFTERDLLRQILRDTDLLEHPIASVMSAPIVSIAAEAIVQEAFDLMTAKGIRRLLVRDAAGTAVGIVTERDLLRWVRDVGHEPAPGTTGTAPA